ncbi:restriction endonuclease subunit S [Paraglaciecola chathamensis]|jgi:type I restriction enzyme S subunit|uniref:Type I restriction endonuclease MjaXP subunit S n=1 Tax=Paraglaciecola chathamensis TaxID=368405 RepID=A0A8H9IIS5_9ALTE|nr:restriction endonuclease subunit S [Paraglaciecola oceanifecundans]GGZ77762.1 type I restriction endonuclease MjaXP subunit S [Paraglaciecola oceanifecundans]|tara:strand:- start:2896 stop:4038 length:1143 start_codon:yes stop_codon:yes gene_type:complete
MIPLVEVNVESLGRIITGKTPSKKVANYFGGKFQFVTPSDFAYKHYFCRKTETTVTEAAQEKHKNQFIPAGSIMFTCIGSTIGKCAIASEECLTNQQINSVIPHNKSESKFIYYLLNHHMGVFRGIGLSGGAAMPIINKTDFSKVILKAPSKSFWPAIGMLLSEYDDLIENNRRRIQLLEDSAHLLYKEWFVHLRFPGHEQVKITDGVPEGWSKEPLENLLVLQRGFDLPVSKRVDGKVPIYASTGINGFHNVAKVNGPGVVTGRSGSLGTVMYVARDFWPLNTALWVKQFKKASPIFATFLLRAMKLEGYNGGAAVPTLNRNDVHKVDVLCPAENLMNEFELQVENIFKQIDKLKEFNEKLAQARDVLLPKLMSGELTV